MQHQSRTQCTISIINIKTNILFIKNFYFRFLLRWKISGLPLTTFTGIRQCRLNFEGVKFKWTQLFVNSRDSWYGNYVATFSDARQSFDRTKYTIPTTGKYIHIYSCLYQYRILCKDLSVHRTQVYIFWKWVTSEILQLFYIPFSIKYPIFTNHFIFLQEYPDEGHNFRNKALLHMYKEIDLFFNDSFGPSYQDWSDETSFFI